MIFRTLRGLLEEAIAHGEQLVVIDGKASGADSYAGDFFSGSQPWDQRDADFVYPRHPNVEHERFPAHWDEFGRAAGPIRNIQMLKEGRPELVYAFHDDLNASRGTADMVRRAIKAHLPVYVISRA